MSGAKEPMRESGVFNLSSAVTMVVDDSDFAADLTTEALMGFGIKTKYVCNSAADAMDVLKDEQIDLLLVDCEMPGMDGHDFVRWLRNSRLDPNAFVPVIMTAGHVRRSKVASVRDCGASFLVTKPFSAATLLQRILWVARDTRPFLQAGAYRGPDRRFHERIPRESGERRSDMLSLLAARSDSVSVEMPTS